MRSLWASPEIGRTGGSTTIFFRLDNHHIKNEALQMLGPDLLGLAGSTRHIGQSAESCHCQATGLNQMDRSKKISTTCWRRNHQKLPVVAKTKKDESAEEIVCLLYWREINCGREQKSCSKLARLACFTCRSYQSAQEGSRVGSKFMLGSVFCLNLTKKGDSNQRTPNHSDWTFELN